MSLAGAVIATRASAAAPSTAATPDNIGIIGSGKEGGGIGLKWAKAGHAILFSSRHPEALQALVAQAGPKARAGLPTDAARFGDVVLLAVPYGAMPEIARQCGELLRGKVVLDASNPRPERDGAMAEDALAKGSGVATAEYLPGARVVRAFNTIAYAQIARDAQPRLGVPLASDDAGALEVARRLVIEAGFDPVVVGGLMSSKRFDFGPAAAPLLGKTAAQIRTLLQLP